MRRPSFQADDAAVKCDLACEVLRSFGSLRFAATGWSMLPTIWPGETLVVERVSPDQVRFGDVILVGRERRLCAHRVVSTQDSGRPHWITQGDAMPAPDRPVSASELLGRVGYVIRAGRLIPVPAELSLAENLIAKLVRRSVPAARALVYLHDMVCTEEKSASEKAVPCQG
jgi:signal peptidase I